MMLKSMVYYCIFLSHLIIYCIGYSPISFLATRPLKVGATEKIPDQSISFFKPRLIEEDQKSIFARDRLVKLWVQRRTDRELNKPSTGLTLTDILLAVNVVIFIFSCRNPKLLRKFAKNDYRLARGETYRFLTALFLHGDVPHLLSNSYSLHSVGPQVERMFGKFGFLSIYLAAGVIANVGTYIFGSSPVAVGASGAISGLLGAYTYYYWANRKVLGSRSALALEGIKRTILYNFIFALGGARNIDHWAHAYGFLVGGGMTALLFLYRDFNLKRRALREVHLLPGQKVNNWKRLQWLFTPIISKKNRKPTKHSLLDDFEDFLNGDDSDDSYHRLHVVTPHLF